MLGRVAGESGYSGRNLLFFFSSDLIKKGLGQTAFILHCGGGFYPVILAVVPLLEYRTRVPGS